MDEKQAAVKGEVSPQGLPICPKCSWAVTFAANHRCDVAAGVRAKQLLAALAPIPGTMYGWGEHAVAFTVGSSTVVLDVRKGHVGIDHVYLSEVRGEKKICALIRVMARVLSKTKRSA